MTEAEVDKRRRGSMTEFFVDHKFNYQSVLREVEALLGESPRAVPQGRRRVTGKTQ
jgi:F0F1-type ATP synthase beta subunit